MPRQMITGWTNQTSNLYNSANRTAAAREVQLRNQLLKAMSDDGVLILMGTDAPQIFSVPGFALHRELKVAAEAGLTPYQVLASGSRNVGRYVAEDLKQDGRFGTVAVGNRADLVLLDANPLQDLSSLTQRSGVMVGGRWVPRTEIDKGLAALAAKYSR